MAQLAMAWVIYNKNVSTALTGASSTQQLAETVKAVEIYKKFTPEIERRIEDIFQNAPTGKMVVATMKPKVSPRVEASQPK